MLIRYDAWGGENRKLAPRLLERYQATKLVNARIDNGNLRPIRAPTGAGSLAKSGEIKSLYRYDDDPVRWFHWTSEVDAVRAPIAGDSENTVVFTGDGKPQVTYASIATSGASEQYPNNSFELGVPAPDNSATVSLNGTPTDQEGDTPEERVYVYTFVATVAGRKVEGPPSPVSASVTWYPGQTVDLTSMDTVPGGNVNVTHKRIYRFNSSDESGDFQFLTELQAASTSYNDSIAPDDAGSFITSTNYDPPPDDLHSLVELPGGILAGLSKNQLCFCEPGLPHAWPVEYRLAMQHTGISLGAFGSTVVVTTDGYPYVAVGADPRSMSFERLETPYACASKRGTVDMGYGVIYPSADGLVLVRPGKLPIIITEDVISEGQWRALNPSSMHAVRWDDLYLCFYDTGSTDGAFSINARGGELVFYDSHFTTAWTDPISGDVYVVEGDQDLLKWDDGVEISWEWESREEWASRPVCMGYVRVDADSYPVDFSLRADGTLQASLISVPDNEPVALPGGYLAQRYKVEMSASATIRQIEVAESIEEMKAS